MNVVPICKGSGGKAFGSEGFGADITGVDLANLTDDTFEADLPRVAELWRASV